MLNSVDLPKGSNPVLEQYDVYRWTSLDAITVLTTLGISNVSPSDSLNFFVPYATGNKIKKVIDLCWVQPTSLYLWWFYLLTRFIKKSVFSCFINSPFCKYLLSGIPWICLFIELYKSCKKLIIWHVSIRSSAVLLNHPTEKPSGLLRRNCLQYCLYCLHCFTFVVATWGRGQIRDICTKLRSNWTYSSIRRVPEKVIEIVKPMLYLRSRLPFLWRFDFRKWFLWSGRKSFWTCIICPHWKLLSWYYPRSYLLWGVWKCLRT